MKRLWLLVPLALAALVAPAFSHADPAPVNLALGAVATASSQENAATGAANAIDGNPATRWSSAFADPQTIQLDLGARASISEIKLTWEAAFGKAYSIDVSDNGTDWTPVTSTTSGDGGTDDYPGLNVTGRYVRLVGTQRGTQFGYSLFEFEVDGTPLQTAVSIATPGFTMGEKDGVADIPVTLNQASATPVTVDYATADGTATGGKDYTSVSGTLTFAPGETSKTVRVLSIDDPIDEPNETFTLNLSNASAGIVIGPRASTTITIGDDDETAFSGKVLNIRDFEGTLNVLPNPVNNVGFFTFHGDDGSNPTITTVNDPRPGSTGTQAMHLVANVTSYGGFSDDFASSQDWTAYDGFSFWFKGTNTGRSIEFEIKDGGTDGEHGELWNSHVTDDSTQWKLVRVPFSSFTRRTDFQPSGAPTDGKLQLTNMWGWAMNLPSGREEYSIDDVQVYQQVVTIDDYESGGTVASHGITTFNGNNAPPALSFEAQPRDGAPDNHALRVDYNTPGTGFGGFQQDFTDPQDWSAFKGFRFWFFGRPHGAAPVKINLEIKDGGAGPGASELWTTSFSDDTVGWHLVEIPFKQFTYRTDFQPVGGINHVLDLTKMWGYAVTPPTSSGSFDWDDVQVYGVAGAAADFSVATDKPVYLAHEGDTVDVGVQLTTRDGQPSKAPVDVTYATSGGTATPMDDYTPTSGTLTFPAGTASGAVQTFPVSVLTDAAAEEAETIGIKLTSPTADVPATTPNVVIDANGLPYLNASLPVEQRIDDLLSRMTQADKIGQMTEVERGAFTNPADIATYRFGSILSGGGSVPASNTPQGWADMIDGFQSQAMSTPLQIPIIYGADEVHGHNNVYGATLFPHNTGMGATRDPALSQQEGAITAAESKATGVPWAFAPCVCVSRDERWGRAYESYGEDPALVQRMETFITGLQGGGVLATAKHFVGDGDTTYGTSKTGSYKIDQGVTQVTRAHLQQIDLPPFDTAVKLGVGSIMPSYSSLKYTDDPNDVETKMHARGDLITGWLKQQEGFDGFVISDYSAIEQIGPDYQQDVKISINAGLDMIMVPFQYTTFQTDLQNEIANGDIPQSRIDDAVRRILREKFRLGLFEHPFADRSGAADFGSAAHRAVARRAASESQVLLKNDGALPLSKSAHIYVAGSDADDLGNQAGGWTISWQGGSGTPTVGTTILQGIQQVAPGATVTYSRDASADMTGSDVGVVVVGETPYAEGVGDVGNGHSLALSPADQTAIDRVCGAMKCVVLVVSGRPMLIGSDLAKANAMVASWLPGTEGAGVADTLFGDKPFTGRLPVSWPRATAADPTQAQVPINVGDASYDPQFPFGWGLRTDAAKARLQSVRSSLSGDAQAQLDALLAADDWNADGSVKNAGDVLARLASLAGAIGDQPFAVQDTIVSVARDIAQAAMVKRGIAANDSTLTADAEHAVLSGDPVTAVRKLAAAANVSVSTTGGVGGTVPATLALTLGVPASFGPFTPGVDHTYTAQTTADVVSTAGDAALSVSDPGHLANGAFTLPQPLQVDIAPNRWAGPVSHATSSITFTQPIGRTDPLRTGTYSRTLTFTLSTTNP